MSDGELDRAIEVFVHGFSRTRSRTYPYLAERVGGSWVLRDAPRRDPAKYRREEWVGHGLAPAELYQLAQTHTRGRYALCVVRADDEDPSPLRNAYRELGFRLGGAEPFLQHRLVDLPAPDPSIPIERVTTSAQADLLREAGGPRLPEQAFAEDGPYRQYQAVLDGVPVGWVASIEVATDGSWCSEMFVVPTQRRRGIGRALLARMLRDDRDRGLRSSVLSASRAGAYLYPTVGYERLGELLVYTPVRRAHPRRDGLRPH
ncbi:GNAT family N-acetyltransferase [Microlunatus parietis]|uniref:GNAT superfamily N-acetyltransferase n=1 Tax=Microlunatus parietis TaxID=682979 RepID=A0A7Y9I4G8_9ACTN|nr:GNAT family N-acetyltransferase [Microlunatus parietis]NYE70100.1 GNAT superfamily N-acetyltransferase [Microlunatus parietis]